MTGQADARHRPPPHHRRYLPGTRLRLRRIDDLRSADREFKFTQKVPAGARRHDLLAWLAEYGIELQQTE